MELTILKHSEVLAGLSWRQRPKLKQTLEVLLSASVISTEEVQNRLSAHSRSFLTLMPDWVLESQSAKSGSSLLNTEEHSVGLAGGWPPAVISALKLRS